MADEHAASGGQSPVLEDHLSALLNREVRFDNVQNRRRKQSSFVNVLTSEQRDLASDWMYEVVIDSNVRSEVFLHAVTVFDNFLDLCIVQTDQVQLCASACLILASKIRNNVLKDEQIIDYTDNSITKTELKVSIML